MKVNKKVWGAVGIFLLITIGFLAPQVNWTPDSGFVDEAAKDEYVEFIPYTLDLTKYTYEDMHVPAYELYEQPDFRENLIFVLDFYKLDYKLEDGKVFIPRQLSKNLDSLADYTRKAAGKEWREKQIELREIRSKIVEDNQ